MAAPGLAHGEATNLALAVISSSNVPLLLLDGDLSVVAASASFCETFDLIAADVPNRPVFLLGDGEWDTPQLRAALGATAAGFSELEGYEIALVRAGRETRQVLVNARKLDYADAANIRLVLSAADVTDTRVAEKIKDDLFRDKDILLRELQHRVANSLQIISSVLLQSARRVQSSETREHLHDAHNRVMSIAAVQHQLATSHLGAVELRSYLAQLCQSLGASMIRDHTQLKLEVSADDSAVDADISVSLGLIVTELVINALKHAFPGGRVGRIVIGYQAEAPNWTLWVSDDGVGMPAHPEHAKAGLGTSIVEALARQLNAHVHMTSGGPGTRVSIVYMHSGARSLSAQRAV
ncbi:sensor histidine kinase [Hansschlegelia plantiphila]|uniref:histidine kinase n=1 Tax=Hansschlegelia plantiphila TaxID=374655 RepID=A0A9W6MVK9_9HYPH|nr:sensor histidine kinase [Hansschlegelia plantiphila]GLK68544.1 histidine kinase [Hansschlegelia plantiphila]